MLECGRWKVENKLGVVDPCFNCNIKESDCPVYEKDKTHTPSYAAEQLEYAKKKENICYNESCERNNKNGLCNDVLLEYCSNRDTGQPTPINYEEEYKRLKAENEEYKQANIILGNFREKQDKKIKELEDLIDGLQGESAELILKCGGYETEISELRQSILDREKALKESQEELKKANLLADEYKSIAAQNKEQLLNVLIQQHNFIHGEYNLVCKEVRVLKNALNKAVEKEG